VTTTLGEGWNLPATEAAATGLPVLAPRHSAHLDFLTKDNSFLFDPDGFAPIPGVHQICVWYMDQLFPTLGKKSLIEYCGLLEYVVAHPEVAATRAMALSDLLRSEYTWDRAAARTLNRLMELQ
jgi:glycosyltransferase involved in cell wall biosynthesis